MFKAEHSDFLGAFSEIGLKSEDMGDIIVEGDRGCLTFTSPETALVLEKRLHSVCISPQVFWLRSSDLGEICAGHRSEN